VVEDDHLQEQVLSEELMDAYPEARVESIDSESEFRRWFDQPGMGAPDVVVMDVMLRWSDPSPNPPVQPKEVAEEGYYRAGLRCAQLMSADGRTANVPVVLYTVLERSDLDRANSRLDAPNVEYVRKSTDVGPLLKRVRAILR
jgi:DNA-binding response OmpR family regulator